MHLWAKILIGMVLGILCGLLLGEHALWLKTLGNIFLQLINMIIPLLVLSTMTVGITNIHDPKKMGKLGVLTLILYAITTILGTLFGLFFAWLFEPGIGLHLKVIKSVETEAPSLSEILLSIFPTNPIASLAEGNVLQIIVFSIFLGLSLSLAGEKGRFVLRFLESLAEVMYKLTGIIIDLSPYGIFAIMAWVTGTFGFSVLLPLSKFVLTLYVGYLVHLVLTFGSMLRFFAKVRVIPFFKGMTDAMLMAFSTGSSSASLPISMNCVQENLGVSKSISGFMLPLGATINMNGTALYQAAAAVFIAQAYGIELSLLQIITIILTALFSAIGTAGIPGSGFIMLAAVIRSAGLPLEGVVLLAGIDRLRDMGGTVLNVVGDAACSVYISKREGELDIEKYHLSRQAF